MTKAIISEGEATIKIIAKKIVEEEITLKNEVKKLKEYLSSLSTAALAYNEKKVFLEIGITENKTDLALKYPLLYALRVFVELKMGMTYSKKFMGEIDFFDMKTEIRNVPGNMNDVITFITKASWFLNGFTSNIERLCLEPEIEDKKVILKGMLVYR